MKVKVRSSDKQELDGPGVDIARRAGDRHRRPAHFGAELVVEDGRRRLLEDLLVPTLDRALAFAEVDDPALLIGEDLKLDVAGILDEFLEIEGRIAKGLLGFVPGHAVGVLEARRRSTRAASHDRRRPPTP